MSRELNSVGNEGLGNPKRWIADEIAIARLYGQKVANFGAGEATIDNIPGIRGMMRPPSGFHDVAATAGWVNDFAHERLHPE